MKIAAIEAIPLAATWEQIYHPRPIPPQLLRPAAHFQDFPRCGQFSTLVHLTADDGSTGWGADDGSTGWGEAWGLPLPLLPALLINDYFAPALVGRDLEDFGAIIEVLNRQAVSLGHSGGVWREAISGVDLALWNWKCRRENRTLPELLGGKKRDFIPTYASPVTLHETPEGTQSQALGFVAQGFRALKIKAGRGVEADLRHLQAAREAVGPEVEILVDFNCSYDLESALRFAKSAENLRLYWLEEPLPPQQIDDLARLRKKCPIPIASGENEFGLAGCRRLMQSGAVDVLTPNISRAGGVSEWLQIAQVAADYGVQVAPQGVGGALMLAASLQILSASENPALFEFNRLPNPLRDELGEPSFRLQDGALQVPENIELRPEIIERYRI